MKKIVFLAMVAFLFATDWLPKESPIKLSWEDAVLYCDNKNARLPTLKELKRIHKTNLKKVFKKDYYWSGSEFFGNLDQAYYFNFYDGSYFHSPKEFKLNVRCVK